MSVCIVYCVNRVVYGVSLITVFWLKLLTLIIRFGNLRKCVQLDAIVYIYKARPHLLFSHRILTGPCKK